MGTVWLSGVDEESDAPVRWHLALHPNRTRLSTIKPVLAESHITECQFGIR